MEVFLIIGYINYLINMIDNFKLIKSLLTFPNDDIYYHLQILRRGKDHPELPAANRMIKAYFIIY